MQVHTRGCQGALQGDDLQLSLEHRGIGLAWTLKSRLAEIAHHSQHKTIGLMVLGQGLQAATQVGTSIEVERHNIH